MFVSLTRVCIVYVVKEVVSFQEAQALGQLMGMAHKRMRAQATDQQEECKLQLIRCIQQRNSIKMMQESLTSTCKYNKLLSFRLKEVEP